MNGKVYNLYTPGASINLVGIGYYFNGETFLFNQPHADMPHPLGESFEVVDVLELVNFHGDFRVLDIISMDTFKEWLASADNDDMDREGGGIVPIDNGWIDQMCSKPQ
jgi:hypothetical protein